MKSRSIPVITIATLLAALGGMALAAQDKYTLQVPNGLAFSDFRGYESWEVVSVAQTEEVLNVIVANPTMIDAYRAGVPGNGKPFPDGSKIAKIQWNPKKSAEAPFSVDVPETLKDVCFHRKGQQKISRQRRLGIRACLTMTPRPIRSHPMAAAPTAGTRVIRSWRQRITSSTRTSSGDCLPARSSSRDVQVRTAPAPGEVGAPSVYWTGSGAEASRWNDRRVALRCEFFQPAAHVLGQPLGRQAVGAD